MKNTQFSAKCRYCIMIHQGALSRASLGVSKAFLLSLNSMNCFIESNGTYRAPWLVASTGTAQKRAGTSFSAL